MSDRADYLTRTLIHRMRSREEAIDARTEGDNRRRVELIEKVLAIESGVLDGATHRLVLSAMPTLNPREPVSPRESAEFAAFARQHVPMEM